MGREALEELRLQSPSPPLFFAARYIAAGGKRASYTKRGELASDVCALCVCVLRVFLFWQRVVSVGLFTG